MLGHVRELTQNVLKSESGMSGACRIVCERVRPG